MSKPHASLSLTTNILLSFAWAAVVGFFLFIVEPRAPFPIAVVGAVLGAICGIMQHLSFKQATKDFSTASSLLEVRAVFKSTKWGIRFLRFLYFSKFILLVVAFVLVREPLLGVAFAYIAGYFSLMFAREIVTLRDTFILQCLC